MKNVTVYGADWCEDTQATLNLLRVHHVDYQYRNLDVDDEATELVRLWYPGGIRTPVVVIESSGLRLAEPTEGELLVALKSADLVDKAA